MKKRIFAIALAAMLTLSMAAPAFAAGTDVNTSGGTQATTFSYTVASSFTVTIPENVTVTGNSGTLSIKTSGVIEAGKQLNIKITGADNYDTTDKFRLKNGTGTDVYLKYTITDDKGAAVEKDTAFATYNAETVHGAPTCTLTLTPEEATQAGTYTDTLTFTVTVA